MFISRKTWWKLVNRVAKLEDEKSKVYGLLNIQYKSEGLYGPAIKSTLIKHGLRDLMDYFGLEYTHVSESHKIVKKKPVKKIIK